MTAGHFDDAAKMVGTGSSKPSAGSNHIEDALDMVVLTDAGLWEKGF